MFAVTVEPVVFLYSVSYVLQLSILQDFIFSKLCTEHFSRQECDAWRGDTAVVEEARWVQEEAVALVMWLSVLTSLVSFLSAQFLGVVLDRHPDKVIMTTPFLGFLGLHVVCVLVAAVPWLPLPWLYLGAILNGLAGGYPVFKASVSSYVVKSVSADERTLRLSLAEGMVFVGNAAGPLTLKWLLDSYDIPHDYLFLGSEVCLVIAILYIIFILPFCPSALQNGTDSHNELAINTTISGLEKIVQEFKGSIATAVRKRPFGGRTSIFLLILADFFIATVFSAEFDLLYLYMHSSFGFSLTQFSIYLVAKNLVNGASLLAVLPALHRLLHLSDAALSLLGGASRVAAFILLALNQSHNLLFLVPFLDMFGQYLFVVERSTLCAIVSQEEQGRVLTVISAFSQLSMLVGSLMFDNLYPVFIGIGRPGYIFFLAAAAMTAAATMLLCVLRRMKIPINEEETGLVQ